MKTMRAVVAREAGEPGDVLTIERVPVPEPGPEQVLGLECAGTVAAVGPGSGNGRGDLRLGRRVATVGVMGTWQEFVVADASRVGVVEHVLGGAADHQSADRVVAGHSAEPRARGMAAADGRGLHRRATRLRPVTPSGARTADRPITKAIDCVAGQVGAEVFHALALGAELVVYGALSTHGQSDPARPAVPVSARSIIYDSKTVRGFFLSRWFATTPPQEVRRVLEEVIALIEDSVLVPPERRPIPADQATHALGPAEAPTRSGKAPEAWPRSGARTAVRVTHQGRSCENPQRFGG